VPRESYVQGLVQRRVKYRIDLGAPTTLRRWIAEEFPQFAKWLEEKWDAQLCPLLQPPSLGLLLINWRGGHLLADVSICAPVSHPAPPDVAFDVYFRRVDVCVEPIAPAAEPVEYVTLQIPSVKQFGRITLREGYAVVKHRGLLFVTSALCEPEARGGVLLKVGKYPCFTYSVREAFRLIKRVLEKRR